MYMDIQDYIKEALYKNINEPFAQYFGELILMSDYLKGRRFLNTEDLRVVANQGRNQYGEIDLELLVSFYFGEVWAHVQSESALIKKTYPWLTISPSLKIKTFLEDKIENLADIDYSGAEASDAMWDAVGQLDFDEAGFDSWLDEYVDEENLYGEYLADSGFADEEDAEEEGGLTKDEWIAENRGDFYEDFQESDKYQEALHEEYERVLKETDWNKGSIHGIYREFEDEYDEICNKLLGVDFDGHSLSSTFDDTYLDSLEDPTVVIKYDDSGKTSTIAWSDLLEGDEISKTPFTVESVQLHFDPTSKAFFDFSVNLDCEVSQRYSEEFSTIQRTIPMVQSFKDQIADSIQKKQSTFDFFKEANTVLPIQVSSSFNYKRELYVEDFTETKKEVDTIGDLRAYFEDTFTINYTVIPSSVAVKGEWVLKSPNPDDVINLKFPPFSNDVPSSPYTLTVVSAKAETLRVNIPAPTRLAFPRHYEFVLWLDLTFKGTVEVVHDLETPKEDRIFPNIKVNADVIESSPQGGFFLCVDSDYNFDMSYSEHFWYYVAGIACTFEFAMSGLSRIEPARQVSSFRLIADESIETRYVVDFRWAFRFNRDLEVQHNSKNKPIFIGKSKKWLGGGSWLNLPEFSKEKNVFPLVEDGSLRRDFPDTNPYGLIGAKSWRPKDHSVNVDIKKNTNFIAQSLLWLWYPNVLSRFGEHGKNFEYLLNAPLGTILTTIYDEVISPLDFMKRFLGPQQDSLAQNSYQLSTEAAAVFGSRELVFDPTTTSETQNKYFLTQSLMRFIYSFCDFYTKPLAILHNFLTIDKAIREQRSNPLLKDKFGIASSISIKDPNKNWLPTYREALNASQKDTSWSLLMKKDNPTMGDLEKEIDLWEKHAVVFEFIEAAKYLNENGIDIVKGIAHMDLTMHLLPPDFYDYFKDHYNVSSPAATYKNLRSNLTKEVSSYTDKFGRQEVSTFSSQLTSSLLWLTKFWTYDIATTLIDQDFLDTDFYTSYLKGDNPSVMHVLDLAYLLKYPTWSTAINNLYKNKKVTTGDGVKKPISRANLSKNIMAYVPIRNAIISTTRTKSKLGPFPNEQEEKATQAERLSLTAFLEIFNIIKLAYGAYTRHDTKDLERTFGPAILSHEPFIAIQSTGFEKHGRLVGVESTVNNTDRIIKKRFTPLTSVYHICIGQAMYGYVKNAMTSEETQVVNFFNTANKAPQNLSACVYYTDGVLDEAKAHSNLVIGAVGGRRVSAGSLHFILNSLLHLRHLNPEIYETDFENEPDLTVPTRSVLPAFYAWANITKVEHAENIGLGEKFRRVISQYSLANKEVFDFVDDIKHLCETYGDVLDCSPFHIRNDNVYSGKSEDFAGGEPVADVVQLAEVLVKAFIQEPTISWGAKILFFHGSQPQDMLPPLFLPVLYDILMDQDEQFYRDYLSSPKAALSGIFNITEYETLLNMELKGDADSAGHYDFHIHNNNNRYRGEYAFDATMLAFNPEKPHSPVAT
jgi:hypothetical protein